MHRHRDWGHWYFTWEIPLIMAKLIFNFIFNTQARTKGIWTHRLISNIYIPSWQLLSLPYYLRIRCRTGKSLVNAGFLRNTFWVSPKEASHGKNPPSVWVGQLNFISAFNLITTSPRHLFHVLEISIFQPCAIWSIFLLNRAYPLFRLTEQEK